MTRDTERTYDGIGPAEVDLLRGLLDDDEAWLEARGSRPDADRRGQRQGGNPLRCEVFEGTPSVICGRF
ncbi:hypothetical protein [Pseudarthrobacter sp. S9]|uniref:hypothetical protein n=1 Tax=Pseudarthrobacter sp. S9 TaxID=3418421 RepID=UPI003CFF2CAD